MHVPPRICGDVFGLMNSLHVPERCVEPSACGSLTLELSGAVAGQRPDTVSDLSDLLGVRNYELYFAENASSVIVK